LLACRTVVNVCGMVVVLGTKTLLLLFSGVFSGVGRRSCCAAVVLPASALSGEAALFIGNNNDDGVTIALKAVVGWPAADDLRRSSSTAATQKKARVITSTPLSTRDEGLLLCRFVKLVFFS